MKLKRTLTEIERNSQKRIKQLIDSKCGGSQQAFADRVGIGKSSVSQYVNGTNFPTNVRAKQIADVFGVSPMWIMGFDVPMDNEEIIANSKTDRINVYQEKIINLYKQKLFLEQYQDALEKPVVQALVSATVGCTTEQIEVAIKLLDAFKTPGAIPSGNNEHPNGSD